MSLTPTEPITPPAHLSEIEFLIGKNQDTLLFKGEILSTPPFPSKNSFSNPINIELSLVITVEPSISAPI